MVLSYFRSVDCSVGAYGTVRTIWRTVRMIRNYYYRSNIQNAMPFVDFGK